MLPWSVELAAQRHRHLAETLHHVLNKRNPATLQKAREIVQEEVGVAFLVSCSECEIRVHNLRASIDRLACSPPRVLTLRYRESKQQGRLQSDGTWMKTVSYCLLCKGNHKLFFSGRLAPAIYGFRCPVRK